MMKNIVLIISLLLFIHCFPLGAKNMNSLKEQGDSAFVKGNYEMAINSYESLLKGGESADVYYNLGNSYYKAGKIAKSIVNYERAYLLQPGDGDIKANLEVARSKTIDKVEPIPDIFFIGWLKAIGNLISLNSWAIIGVVGFLLFIFSLCCWIFSKRISLRKIGFSFGLLFLVLTICANFYASHQKDKLLNRNAAIIMQPSIIVRSTPSEGGTTLFILHEGHKVFIKDNSMKEWKEVRLENGNVGWVPTSSIEVI